MAGDEARDTALMRVAIDAATAELVCALDGWGIRSVLLKGAAVAARLYDDPAERKYRDFDVLVDPRRFAEAEQVVRSLGYEEPAAEYSEERARHHSAWRRGPVALDLHHTLAFGHGDPVRLWEALSADTRRWRLRDAEVEVLADRSLALLLSVHVVQHGPAAGPRRDLELALDRFDRRVWPRAALLASDLEMSEAFAAGLRQVPRGQTLARELDLRARTTVEINLRLSGAVPVSDGLRRLSEAGWSREGLCLMAAELRPHASFMQERWRLARRGRRGLALAYLYRLLWLAFNVPRAFLHWRYAARRASVTRDRNWWASREPDE